MQSSWFRSLLFLPIFLLSACSVDVSQPTAALPVLKVENTREAAAYPVPSAVYTSSSPAVARLQPVSKVPVVWADLKLSGRLIFVRATLTNDGAVLSIHELDLANGDLYTLFQSPPASWIYTLSVSPDAKTLVMSYYPPAVNNQPSYQTLYQMPLDGSQPPSLLFSSPLPEDQFLQPEWSPDGRYVYFSHTNYATMAKDQHYPRFQVYRMLYTGGNLELIADKAFWPRLSRDGKQLVFIAASPQDGKNAIWLADPDGSNAHQVPLSPGAPNVIDSPVFSPDGQSILFSAPVLPGLKEPAPSSWLDRLLGIGVVEAHSLPSDWWQVPLSGGSPILLTHISSTGLFASLSPDGRFFASYSSNSLFVMNPDGSGLRIILDDLGGANGSVNWLP